MYWIVLIWYVGTDTGTDTGTDVGPVWFVSYPPGGLVTEETSCRPKQIHAYCSIKVISSVICISNGNVVECCHID